MSLLLPLGLLALLSLLVLLLIYILKPNYQQKYISSTFVWKLSLKYRKKQVPISKLRNLLIILCQILILVLAALVISDPANVTVVPDESNEQIIIIDASGSMLAEQEGTTRFTRAVNEAKQIASEAFDNNGTVSVVLANNEAEYVVQRASAAEREFVNNRLDGLACSYSVADVKGAVDLAQGILQINPDAQVKFITGSTNYIASGDKIKMQYVSVEGEWNAGILGVECEKQNGYYTFTVEVGCYGRKEGLTLFGTVTNGNIAGSEVTVTTQLPAATVRFGETDVVKVVYWFENPSDEDGGAPKFEDNVIPVEIPLDARLHSFDSIYFHIDEQDGFLYDNEYYLYGGNVPPVKIQYCSDLHQNFINSSLLQVTGAFRKIWDIRVKETKPDTVELSGYDFYIFENIMPATLPTDGVIYMINPDKSAGAGFTVGREVTIPDTVGWGATLAPGDDQHPIMEGVFPSMMHITSYKQISQDSLADGYQVLMYYEGNPLFFIKDEPKEKIIVSAASYARSDFAFTLAAFNYNVFEYFLPPTFDSHVYNVFDAVNFNARGPEVTVQREFPGAEPVTFDTFPARHVVTEPGIYSVSQTLMSSEDPFIEKFYVRLDSKLSNIFGEQTVINSPIIPPRTHTFYEYLLVWFAAAMVLLLFVEWILSSRNSM